MNLMEEILAEITGVLKKVDQQQLLKTTNLLTTTRRIFILGEGRSGLQGKGFAMRLMHIGATVYVIGETITPAIKEGDILVAISGSGTTGNVLSLAEKAKKNKVELLGITSNAHSPLGKIADWQLIIPGATKTGGDVSSIQLLSTLFDQTLHITLDYLCLQIARKKKVSNQQANQQHSNLE